MNNTINIEKLIKTAFPNLSKGEKKVASYVIDNYNSVALLSSSELAKKTDVSDTTVIRFAKSLGFNGYLEFKKALRSSVYSSNMYESLKGMNVDTDNEYPVKYMLSTVSDLREFVQAFDYELVNKIAEILLNANQIYIGGLGSDSVIAQYLFTYIRKMGFGPVLLVEEGHTLAEYLLNITRGDVLLMCSYPKMFNDEIKMAKLAKENGATLITITDSEISSMILNSDYNVSIRQKEKTFFNSYVIPMAFCNLLLLKINELAPERVEKSLKKYTDIIDS